MKPQFEDESAEIAWRREHDPEYQKFEAQWLKEHPKEAEELKAAEAKMAAGQAMLDELETHVVAAYLRMMTGGAHA